MLRQPSGNAKQWICLFHRWTFNSKGDCIAIPREDAYEESGICKENRGLREVRTGVRLDPSKTLVEWRGIGIKGESAADRAMRRDHHNQVWGPLGRNLYEDAYAVECVEAANRHGAAPYAVIARHEDLKTQDDAMMRSFYQEWSRRMGRPAHNPLNAPEPA